MQLFGYWWYNTRSKQKINTGSWAIWGLGGVVDLVSYFALTHDWVVNILPAVCAFAAVATFGYAVVKKRFSPLERLDYLFLSADAGITVTWFFTNVVVANLLFQVSTVISFVPMIHGLIQKTDQEQPEPWLIWASAYTLLTFSVLLRLERWEDLVYPVSHVITHLIVAFVALQMRSPYVKA